MATLIIKDHDYHNWVKGGLALNFSKDGIENFVETNIDKFHKNVLTRLPAGPHCYICSTENIIQCKSKPNNNFCKFSKNNCTVHDPNDTSKKSRPCPSAVCNVVRDEILKQHRFNGPSWKNTDSSRWCREPWQLATCYMSAGYQAATSASRTDFPGLLSVVINNTIFDTEVTDDLSNKKNLFCLARDARNSILHNADMRLSDAELAAHITTLDIMLADAQCLAQHPEAIQARTNLQQLLNGTLNVTTRHEADVLAEALRSIDDKKVEAIAAVNKEKDAAIINLQKALHDAHSTIKEKEEEAVANVHRISRDSYDKLKKDLKAELLSVYQDGELLYTPLSPLDSSEDKHIEQLYVSPDMMLFDYKRDEGADPTEDNNMELLYSQRHKRHVARPRQQKGKGTAPDMNQKEREGKSIETYKDMFKEGNKKIYVVGEAGTGKTSFCQKMMSTWCQVQTEHLEQLSDNQQAMEKFDFLFYISLRDETTRSCVDEMIKHSLLLNKERLHEPLSKVLEEERCLVILDGLDEWTTENKTASPSHINKGIPGRNSIRNCTVITTTRPWKLEVLQLKSSQIDAKVELLGIDTISSERLIQKIIMHLNAIHHSQKNYKDFMTKIQEKKLNYFIKIPVILKQLVCLWDLGKELGTTKCAIYSQLLELLFAFAQNRLKTDSYFQNKKYDWSKSEFKLPSCFDTPGICQDFKPLLFAIAKLAFQTLLSDDQESSLVFKSTQAGCYHLSQAEVDICLKIGILTQNKSLIKCASPFRRISFLHKTYQEFLAALFVSLNKSNSKQCVKQIQNICNNKVVCGEMTNVLTFISGICTSDLTCELLAHFNKHYKSAQSFLLECIREGYTCSHRSGLFGRRGKHLHIEDIDIREPSQYLDQLCEINIPNIEKLTIYSPPTAQCLPYLLQINKLEQLRIYPESHSSISEDLVYDLIHNHRHTLTWIGIVGMTLRSNTRLSNLIPKVQHLSWLSIYDTTLPQQLLTSLQALHSVYTPPYMRVFITRHTILPETQSTD